MVYQEYDYRPGEDEMAFQNEASPPLSLEEIGQRAWEVRENILSTRKEVPTKVSVEVEPSRTVSGAIDLKDLVKRGKVRESDTEEQSEAHRKKLEGLYRESNLLMANAAEIVKSDWQAIRDAEDLMKKGYLPATEEVEAIISDLRSGLRNWPKIFFPPRFFYETTPSQYLSQYTEFNYGEIVACVCSSHPAEGFTFETLSEIASFAVEEKFRGDKKIVERTKGYIKGVKLSFTMFLLNLGKQLNIPLDQLSLTEFVKQVKTEFPWQLQFLEAITPWHVESGGETFVYGDLTVKQFIEGVLNRFGETFGWRKIRASEKEKEREPAISKLRLPTASYDLLAATVNHSPRIALTKEEEFAFSPKSIAWAANQVVGMREEQREVTGEDLEQLQTQLNIIANARRDDLIKFIERRRSKHPVLAELAEHCLDLDPKQRAKFFRIVLEARPPDLIKEVEKKRVNLASGSALNRELRAILGVVASRLEERHMGPPPQLSIFQAEGFLPSLTLGEHGEQRRLVDKFGLAYIPGPDDHPRYPWATFLQMALAQEFEGTQAKGVLERALRRIEENEERVKRLLKEVLGIE